MHYPSKLPPGFQRYRLHVAYDGTGVAGWQRQGHDPNTIQEILENRLSEFFNQKIILTGASRTDSGVHAELQVAHFDAPFEPAREERLHHALIRMVPRNIAVKAVYRAPPDFHAQNDALKKTYKYRIVNAKCPNAFYRRFSYWVYWPLKLRELHDMAQIIMGEHDFKSFETSGAPRVSTVRTILDARWIKRSPTLIEFQITGTGFLKQMVRNIVGTMLEMDRKGLPPKFLREIMDAKDRRKALACAPAEGLTLYKVYYPQSLDFRCHKI